MCTGAVFITLRIMDEIPTHARAGQRELSSPLFNEPVALPGARALVVFAMFLVAAAVRSRHCATSGTRSNYTALIWIKVWRSTALKVGPLAKYGRCTKMIRTILVPLATELSSEALLDAALLVAKRLDSQIRVLFTNRIQIPLLPTFPT